MRNYSSIKTEIWLVRHGCRHLLGTPSLIAPAALAWKLRSNRQLQPLGHQNDIPSTSLPISQVNLAYEQTDQRKDT
jgi:hypothetical protein